MALRTPVVVQPKTARDTAFAETMKDIRIWLDNERIQPAEFKAVVGRAGLGFEISFNDEGEAERFQERFASLMP
jgi:hypothetical protein